MKGNAQRNGLDRGNFIVGFHIGSIVVKQVALNVGLDRPVQQIKLARLQIEIVAIHHRIATDMPRLRRCKGKKILEQCAFIGATIGPKSAARLPNRNQSNRCCWADIVLHVKRESQESQSLAEMIYDLGVMVERVRVGCFMEVSFLWAALRIWDGANSTTRQVFRCNTLSPPTPVPKVAHL